MADNDNSTVANYVVVEFNAVVANSGANVKGGTFRRRDGRQPDLLAQCHGDDRGAEDRHRQGDHQHQSKHYLVTYQLTFNNTGNSTAYSVALSDTLPGTDGSVTGSTGGSWTTSFSGTGLTGSLASLAAGSTATVTYTVTASATGVAATQAAVTWQSVATSTGGAAGSATGARNYDGSNASVDNYQIHRQHRLDRGRRACVVRGAGGSERREPALASVPGADRSAFSTVTTTNGVQVTASSETFTLATGGTSVFGSLTTTTDTSTGAYGFLLPSQETVSIEGATASSSGSVTLSVPTSVTASSVQYKIWYDYVGSTATLSQSTTSAQSLSGTSQLADFAYAGGDTAPTISWNAAGVVYTNGIAAIALGNATAVSDPEIDANFPSYSYLNGQMIVQRSGGHRYPRHVLVVRQRPDAVGWQCVSIRL